VIELDVSVTSPRREDMYSQDSIDLLQNSGLQFKKHEEEGIETLYFAELLMTSGLVLCENVKWLSFHRLVDFCTTQICLAIKPSIIPKITQSLDHFHYEPTCF